MAWTGDILNEHPVFKPLIRRRVCRLHPKAEILTDLHDHIARMLKNYRVITLVATGVSGFLAFHR
ncbi:MAG: hypothetical protein ACK58T_19655, partial [Phycisphaerae bacterium]